MDRGIFQVFVVPRSKSAKVLEEKELKKPASSKEEEDTWAREKDIHKTKGTGNNVCLSHRNDRKSAVGSETT